MAYDFFNVPEFKELDDKTKIFLMRNHPVVIFEPADECTSRKMMIGREVKKTSNKNFLSEAKLHLQVDYHEDDGTREYNVVEVDIMPSVKSCIERATESFLENSAYSTESMEELFGDETCIAWMKGELVNAKLKHHYFSTEASNLKEWLDKLHKAYPNDAHASNSGYSDDGHGEFTMNRKALELFGYNSEDSNSDGFVENEADGCPYFFIDDDKLFKESGIEMFTGYGYITDISENDSYCDDDNFIEMFEPVLHDMKLRNRLDMDEEGAHSATPPPSPKF